ncbi:hypothetical protein F4778DRAFT_775494 [Xylariomycetidae sp. FL2044]|nr:hypothetical protein F4778DRAFT_775494 [Xylariomycetidae sp. FL2044]
MASNQDPAYRTLNEVFKEQRIKHNNPSSHQYHGHITSKDALVVLNCPEHSNTSLFLRGLPPQTNHYDILHAIRKCGTVKQVHIMPPSHDRPDTCAATLVFFQRTAAEKVLQKSQNNELSIRGVTPTVVWNLHKKAEEDIEGRSRVLRIEGPEELVRVTSLEQLWSQYFYWDIDRVIDVGEIGDGKGVVWYFFASWYCQASNAMGILKDLYGHIVKVEYMKDPCA